MRRKIEESENQSSVSNMEEEYSRKQLSQATPKPNQKIERTRRTNQIQRSYQQELSGGEEDEQLSKSSQYIYFTGGRVSKVLAQRIRPGQNVIQRLCKFRSKSYLHLQWLTNEEVKTRNIQMVPISERIRSGIKSRLEQIQQKYGKEHYFNPYFVKVDRILTRAVMFPLMHHKKGSQMNGKWSQMMMLVCSKILNFQKDNIPYGIIQKDDFHPEFIEEVKAKDKIRVEHIINRVYLDKYKTPELFWQDVGESIRCLHQLLPSQSDKKEQQILKECIIFLYWQWFCLSKQRFLTFLPKIPLYQKIKKDLQSQNCKVNFKISSDSSNFNLQKEMLKQNIFIRENYGQKPTEQKQLLPLHPGKFSYDWLLGQNEKTDYTETTFHHLDVEDIKILDLNVEIDHLYLIKWCDLEYDELTWEKESDLKCPEKIQSFRQYCKIPSKKDRQKIDENKKFHKAILTNLIDPKEGEPAQTIQKYRRKLYNYSYSTKEIKQYGGQDIPVYKGYKLLKNFQLEGLNWLIKSWHERKNCILADEMGLGKTIQTIAFLNHLHVFENVLGPFLIVAPVSTLKQWRNQIEQWSDLNCVLYKGKKSSRDLIQEYEFYHKFVTNEGILVKFQKLPRFQILLTNYQVFTSDIEIFQKIAFQQIVIDEAQRMKNTTSKISRTLKELPCTRILLLSGTPIQNNTSEIFGLLNVIEPKRFNSIEVFKQKFGNLKTADEIEELKVTLKPYLMRRVKSDVEKTIPKLSEMLVTLQLTPIQRAYYLSIIEKNKSQLLSSLNSVLLNSIAQCLRRCSNHPYLLSPQIQDEITSKCQTDEEKFDAFITASIKMIFIHKFLAKCRKDRTKTLIFTQYLDMIELLKQYCIKEEIQYETLNGAVKYEQRQNRIDRFNTNPDVLVFIISTKAGGVGINLTSATNIIIYDSDWNPQNDIQAIARAHRIGQHKNVTVYRLVTTKTYEETIYQSAVRKLGIGLAILDNDYFTNQDIVDSDKKERSKQEIQLLLKEGISGFLMSQQMSEERPGIQNLSIEDIIARNCTNVQYQTKDCSFTSTKFESGEKIDPEDPNYWQVALQRVQSPLQKLTKKMKDDTIAKQIFESPEEQLKLMLESNQIVFDFVKSKISMSHFNAQEERDLRSFLEKITESRQFHREFKRIANDWLEEIQKPSRRFEKYDVNKLKELISSKVETRLISRIRPKKFETRLMAAEQINSRSKQQVSQMSQEDVHSQEQKLMVNQSKYSPKRKNKKLQISSNNNSESAIDEEIPQQFQEQKPSKKRQSNKKSAKVQEQVSLEQDYVQIYQRGICAFCHQKSCSKFCKGRCQRIFHSKCYQKYKAKDPTVPTREQKTEFRLSQKEIIKSLMEQFECFECKTMVARCFICNEPGKVIPSSWGQRGPKKPLRYPQCPDQKNQIEGVLRNATQEEKKRVYQCRMEYCTKAYHLSCLDLVKDKFKYQFFGNKELESYPLKCPHHYCSNCSKNLTVHKCSCLLCPISYHQKCRNSLQSSLFDIDQESFICKAHMSSQQIERKERQKQKVESLLKETKIQEKRSEKARNRAKEEKKTENKASKLIAEKLQETFKQIEERAYIDEKKE